LEKGNWSLNTELINKFPHKAKDLFKIWYKPDKNFKLIPSSEYPANLLRMPYQYVVAIVWRIYGEQDASKLTLSMIPLIYYCDDEGFSFNWIDIVSTSLAKSIIAFKETAPD
jgi:hypothetical protein